jgi:2,5-furandicarboxylate decarboxylase 1
VVGSSGTLGWTPGVEGSPAPSAGAAGLSDPDGVIDGGTPMPSETGVCDDAPTGEEPNGPGPSDSTLPLQAITRAFGKLHADEKLWQDKEGRMCVRGSAFAAKAP